jgi:hypothetical protein
VRLLVSSYAAWRPEFGAPVVVSLSTPRNRPEAKTWPRLWAATPRWAWFRADEQVFEQAFLDQLDRYGKDDVMRRLQQIAASGYAEPAETLVLCCFEADVYECHRGTFRCWLHEHGGPWAEDISELTG